MCWAALDRGVPPSEKRAFPADRSRWLAERDELCLRIMREGWSEERRSFVQDFGSDRLEAERWARCVDAPSQAQAGIWGPFPKGWSP